MTLGVAVLTRVPRAGNGKSRLRPAYAADRIAELQRAMLGDTLAALDRLAPSQRVVLVAPLDGEDACAAMAPETPPGWALELQRGEGLGERLVHASAALFARGASVVLLCGSDAPVLPVARLAAELGALREDHLVMVPADDGGYAALALARPEPALFEDVPWSTARVAEVTCARARERGLTVRRLDPVRDVDTPDDLAVLARLLAASPADAPRTAALLRTW